MKLWENIINFPKNNIYNNNIFLSIFPLVGNFKINSFLTEITCTHFLFQQVLKSVERKQKLSMTTMLLSQTDNCG